MSEEKNVEIVGDYVIISEISYCHHASNPLKEDEWAGEIHGNHSRYRGGQWSGIGQEHEFRKARGCLNSENSLDPDDFLEDAALLAIAETDFDVALEAMEAEFEWSDEERADAGAFRAEVMRLFAEHVMKEYRRSWPKLPEGMWDGILEKAEALATVAVNARAVGNKYAVPMSITGYYEMNLKPDLGKDFVEMEPDDILWIPSAIEQEEFDQLPYAQAMERAVVAAERDGKEYAQWASGNVYDLKVDVYRLEHDDDGDEIEDPEHYEDGEAEVLHSDEGSEYVGTDYAEKQLAIMIDEAKKEIAQLEAEDPAVEPSGPSMSM